MQVLDGFKSLTHLHVGFEIPAMILPNGPSDRGPRTTESQDTLDSIAFEEFPGLRMQNARLDTKERHGCTSRLGLDSTGEWSDDNGSRLCLPVGIDNGALLLSDVLVVPMPCLWVNGFTD
jgi:hypothetical protein